MPRPLRNAWALAPIYRGEVLAALALWYVTSERPRLRSRVIVNGMALLFILRLINRVARRETLALYPDGVMPPEDDPFGHL